MTTQLSLGARHGAQLAGRFVPTGTAAAGVFPSWAPGPMHPAAWVPEPFQTIALAGPWQFPAGTTSVAVNPSFCLKPSKLAKKNVLSFLIGPPNEPPKLFLTKGGRS